MPDETQTPGVPAGVRITRVGVPRDGDYELSVKMIQGQEVSYVYLNRPGHRNPGTIVEPIEGYEMVPDGKTGTFLAKKKEEPTAPPTVSLKAGATVSFEFEFDGKPAGTLFRAEEVVGVGDITATRLVPVE